MYHAAALATEIAALYHGGCVVVTRDSDPKALLAEIVRQRVTHALVVPSTLAGFLEIPDVADLDYRHLRTLAYGATPIAPSLLRRCLDTFPVELAQGYGMTEACAAICVLPDADHRDPAHPERLASVGKPVAGMEIQIADLATGKPLAPGETGEVRLRSAQLMLGYWDGHRPDTTAFTADGWLCTGDAGYVDEDGYVYLSGRLKDMYLNDGWNVYAAVVERVLAAHPAVAEAAVIGVPHDTWGEVGMAFLIPAGPESGTTIDEADVLRHCREHLAEYEVPQTLVFVSEFERNALGKVVKDELRALARCQKSR
jgi:long-chain acyl-CoA synthetase